MVELPGLSRSLAPACQVSLVMTEESNSSSILRRHLFGKEDFAMGRPLVLARRVTRSGARFCLTETRLACSNGAAEVTEWRSCCSPKIGISTNCEPKLSELENSGLEAILLQDRLSQWTTCHNESKDVKYEMIPEAGSAQGSAAAGVGTCLKAVVVAKESSLQAELDSCPWKTRTGLNVILNVPTMAENLLIGAFTKSHKDDMIGKVLHRVAGMSYLDPSAFGKYGRFASALIVELIVQRDEGRQALAQMHHREYLDRLVVYDSLTIPIRDPEADRQTFNSTSQLCLLNVLRDLDTNDDGLDSSANTWAAFLDTPRCANGGCARDFLVRVFDSQTERGNVYPSREFDVGIFKEHGGASDGNDSWLDTAESFLAFEDIGAHRVRRALCPASCPSANGTTGLFFLDTRDLADIPVRGSFGQPGVNMWFDLNRAPIMVETPSGSQVWKSNVEKREWQYWKWVWRSSVVQQVLLVDNLWTVHFGVANVLAAASREALPAQHPLRWLLSVFTSGTIEANLRVAHQLVGPDQLLQRAFPFQKMEEVAKLAENSVPSLKETFGVFMKRNSTSNESTESSLLKDTPYYEDGQQLFNALEDLVSNFTEQYKDSWCSGDNINDRFILHFFDRVRAWSLTEVQAIEDHAWLGLLKPVSSTSPNAQSTTFTCSGLGRYLSVMLFAVTGFHRHVSMIGDLLRDPYFAGLSWKKEEAFSRPNQSMRALMVVAGTTATVANSTKLDDDYTGLWKDPKLASKVDPALAAFRTALAGIRGQMLRRSATRKHPHARLDPHLIESSVLI